MGFWKKWLYFKPFCITAWVRALELPAHLLTALHETGLPYHRGKKQRSVLSTLVSGVLFCTFERNRLGSQGSQ
jgi:hypothetical protein